MNAAASQTAQFRRELARPRYVSQGWRFLPKLTGGALRSAGLFGEKIHCPACGRLTRGPRCSGCLESTVHAHSSVSISKTPALSFARQNGAWKWLELVGQTLPKSFTA